MTPVTDKQALEHMRKHSVNPIPNAHALIHGTEFVKDMGYDDWIFVHHCQLYCTPSTFRGSYYDCVAWYALTCGEYEPRPMVMAGKMLWLDTTY